MEINVLEIVKDIERHRTKVEAGYAGKPEAEKRHEALCIFLGEFLGGLLDTVEALDESVTANDAQRAAFYKYDFVDYVVKQAKDRIDTDER